MLGNKTLIRSINYDLDVKISRESSVCLLIVTIFSMWLHLLGCLVIQKSSLYSRMAIFLQLETQELCRQDDE